MIKKALTILGLSLSVLASGCMTRMDAGDDNQPILFVSSRSGYKDIYKSDVMGERVQMLTNDSSQEAHPHWLPDGRIVFASDRTGTWDIYTMNADGSNVKPVTQDRAVNNYRPFPSPDGRIVFVSDRMKSTHIFSVLPDGMGLKQLTGNKTLDRRTFNDYPVVSNEGMVYFTSSRSSKWEIWQMSPEGHSPSQVTHTLRNVLEIAIAPATIRDSMLRTTNMTSIPRVGYMFGQPQTKLLYTMQQGTGLLDIYRMNLDGSDWRNLTSRQTYVDRSPVLLPNGRILFTTDRQGNTDVWSMTIDGRDPRPVITHSSYDSTS